MAAAKQAPNLDILEVASTVSGLSGKETVKQHPIAAAAGSGGGGGAAAGGGGAASGSGGTNVPAGRLSEVDASALLPSGEAAAPPATGVHEQPETTAEGEAGEAAGAEGKDDASARQSEDMDAMRSELRGTPQGLSSNIASAVLEAKKVSLMEHISDLMGEERTLEQAEWKVTKLQKPAVTQRLAQVRAEIKQTRATLEDAIAEASVEADVAKFEQGMTVASEIEEYAPVTARGEVERPVISGKALVIFEADGIVSDLGGGIQEELLRILKGIVEKSGAQLVLSSEWRGDVRTVRQLNAIARKIEMREEIHLFTPGGRARKASAPGDGGAEREQAKADEVMAFIYSCSAEAKDIPWVCIDTLDLVNAPGMERPLQPIKHLRIEPSKGLTASDASRLLNMMRAQIVASERRSAAARLSSSDFDEMELAFAMGTHYRLGERSIVDSIRKDPRSARRGIHKRGGRDPVNLIQKVLRSRARVPEDYASLEQAIEACSKSAGVTLTITLAAGDYSLSEPIKVATGRRVVIEAAPTCKLGDVRLRTVGALPVVCLSDESFLRDPLSRPGHGHSHVELRGLVLEQGLMDRDRYVANWIAAVSEENKMKETRGFYRKMLLSAGVYKTAEEADLECKSIDECKEVLARFYCAAAERNLSKELEAGCKDLPPERWPRVIEVTEGSCVIERCRIVSEAGTGVYAGRTGAVRIESTQVTKCRASGIVVAEGGHMEAIKCNVSSCGAYGAVCKGAMMRLEGGGASSCKVSGVGAMSGGLVSVEGMRISECAEAGLSCVGEQTSVRAKSCVIESNGSYGVTAQSGGRIDLIESKVRGNVASGITCGKAGACILAMASEVAANGANGVVAAEGGAIKVEGGGVRGNKSAGALAVGGGHVMLKGVQVSSNGSHGVVAQRGGQGTMAECGVDANSLSGITCIHAGSRVRVSEGNVGGSRVGVYAAAGGEIYLDVQALVEGNSEANEGCVDDGKILREQPKRSSSVLARPLSAKNR